jgi:signal peptidase I
MDASHVNDRSPSFIETAAALVESGHGLRFRASGRSMYPTINAGELITVMPIATDDVRVGDIILYRSEKSVIAHRVEKIDKSFHGVTRLLLRGDASESRDQPVLSEQILGRVVAVERGGRQFNLTGRYATMLRRFRVHGSRLKRKILPYS